MSAKVVEYLRCVADLVVSRRVVAVNADEIYEWLPTDPSIVLPFLQALISLAAEPGWGQRPADEACLEAAQRMEDSL